MIQDISRDDIPECVEVIRKSFLTVAREFGFTPENAPRFTGFVMCRELLEGQFSDPNRKMFGYFEAGSLLGYCSILLLEDKKCELNNLAVLPNSRHKGIGRALMAHAQGAARELGCEKLILSLVEENQLLRGWYEEQGFLHTGTKKFDHLPFTSGYMEKAL